MDAIGIVPWQKEFRENVIQFILSIQRNEFQIPITEADQPDLKNVDEFYQQGNGNFWVAVLDNYVIGTLALLDIGHHQVALRKMFVHKDFRGDKYGLAKKMLLTAIEWCIQRNIQDIYLGTVEVLKAAQKFYEKNGFSKVDRDQLPDSFPVMKVDTIFYHLSISK